MSVHLVLSSAKVVMDNQLASTNDPHYSTSGLVPNFSRMATVKKNSDPLWAKVAALESSIAAVEREQEIVEKAMLTRSPDDPSSSQGFPSRIIRGLLVGKKATTLTTPTTTDDRQVNKTKKQRSELAAQRALRVSLL